ncbi:hypothetical protein CYQ88_07685 [Hydrogenovibrio sp. SC-1]|uniref:immunoglobulin-like domain-containing protein n=1 Tax=Hydrogenovibrio sp. SC-1 TaxID=2065820 RepID=UPI000C7D05F7|nr:immunoglobulin-like domain-containing protein [Hydrogenovibrio sp. SC-1]PLA74113.1 hypothetical protein CYQ88_07685 [Hydrogenovibrio sp. SC-1]
MNDFVAQVLRIEGIAQVVHLSKRTVKKLYEADYLTKYEVLVLADHATVVLAMNNGHHFLLDQTSPFMSQYHSVFIEDLVAASSEHVDVNPAPKEPISDEIAKLLEESYISSNIKASLDGWVSSSVEPGLVVSRNEIESEPLIDFRGLTQPIPFEDPKMEIPTQAVLGQVALTLSGLEEVSEGGVANYTLSLSEPPVTTLTVVLSVGNIETNEQDYDAPTLSVIFSPNQMTANFGIEVQLDKVVEGDERFQVAVVQAHGGGFEQTLQLPEPMQTRINGEGAATSRSMLPEIVESETVDAYFSYIQDSQEGGARLMLTTFSTVQEAETVHFLVNEMTKNEWLEEDLTLMEQ